MNCTLWRAWWMLIYMDIGEVHKAQNRMDTALNIYSEMWKDEPELLEAKYAEFQSSALKTLFTSTKADKLREFMDKNCC